MVIGAQRAGTSSLFTYLARSPGVARGLRKETEYYSRRYSLGKDWYLAHYPAAKHLRRQSLVTFEATPDYLYWPSSPGRIARDLPDIPLVVMLRNPVVRAWSHFQHMQRLGFETLEFIEALEAEPHRIRGKGEEFKTDPEGVNHALLYSYTDRGRYSEQLSRWYEHFDETRFLVVFLEELLADPEQQYAAICRHVGIPPQPIGDLRNYSYAGGQRRATDQIPSDAASLLSQEFMSHDAALSELLGRSVPWADSAT